MTDRGLLTAASAQIEGRLRALYGPLRLCGIVFDAERAREVSEMLSRHLVTESVKGDTAREIAEWWVGPDRTMPLAWWATPVGALCAAAGFNDQPGVVGVSMPDAAVMLGVRGDSVHKMLRAGSVSYVAVAGRMLIDRASVLAWAGGVTRRRRRAWPSPGEPGSSGLS